MKLIKFLKITFILTILIIAATSRTAFANEAPKAADLSNKAEVAAFVDQEMTKNMEKFHIPGAVIAIVKDQDILFSSGYGYANRVTKQEINPETSMFRIASTTKLFTWTAVMQLVEAGKINLDENINNYLTSFKIPDTFKEPITMRHLMTHTAGFEEGGVGYQITTDEKNLPVSLNKTLEKHLPARIRPVGQLASYSNYGASLAGLIIEEVSGQTYDDYIQVHIFNKLNMNHATVREPLPTNFSADKVLGYNYQNKQFIAGTPTYEGGFRPAGSGTVAANDMAQFMLAHLNQGTINEKQILKPATTDLMHQTAFRFDKRLPGSALGFQEGELNGQKLLSHAGADPMFITDLYLVPEQKVGIFMSYSGGDADGALAAMKTAFFDHYFPIAKSKVPTFLPMTPDELTNFTGSYKFSRRNYSDIDKFFSLLTEMTVNKVGDKLAIGQGSEQELFGKIDDNLFQQVDGQHMLSFKTNDSGKATALLLSFIPDMPLEKTKLIDRSLFWLPLLGGAMFIFSGTIGIFLLRIRRLKTLTKSARQGLWLALMTALTALTTMILTVTNVLNMDVLTRLSSVSLTLNLFLILPIVTVLLTIVLTIKTITLWSQRQFSFLGRLAFSLVPTAGLLLSWFFYHWNLLGWQFG